MRDRHAGFIPLIAAFLVSLFCCSEFVLYDLLDGPDAGDADGSEPGPLVLSPSVAAVLINATVNFTATGGSNSYLYSIVSGGGAIDSMTGVYTAPAVAASVVVQVEDSDGSTDQSAVSVLAPTILRIYPSSVTLAVNASFQFSAAGGIPPFSFSKVAGVGSITAEGLFNAGAVSDDATSVRVTDSVGAASDASVSVVSAGVLGMNPLDPSVEEGESISFAGYGGSPAYSYTLTVSGSGGAINSATGRYTAGHSIGTSIDTVRVSDSAADSVETSVTVVPAAPTDLVADGAFGGPQDIRLTWTDNSQSEDGFRIERKIGNAGTYQTVTIADAGTVSYDDLELSPNTAYVYRVFACSGALDSPASNEAFDVSNP